MNGGQILDANTAPSGQSSAHLAPLYRAFPHSLTHPHSFLPSVLFAYFHPFSPFHPLPYSLPPPSSHSINSFTKYLLNSYFMLVCARCWGYSGKQGRHTVPSLMEPTVQKALNNYYRGHVCNDRQPPDTGMGMQQGDSTRLRDHGQGTHFLIALYSTL